MQDRGNISSKLWLIQNMSEVSENDKLTNTLFSGASAYHFDKMLEAAGLSPSDIYYHINKDTNVTLQLLSLHKPVVVLLCGSTKVGIQWDSLTVKEFCPDVASRKKPFQVSLDKQAGSLLVSPKISYPHYCLPIWPPNKIFAEWSYRDIFINLDLGRAKEELDFFYRNGKLNPLPSYSFVVEPTFAELQDYFFDKLFKRTKIAAGDIETIGYQIGKKKLEKINNKKLFQHPGYPYVMGLANSTTEAISFSLWDYSPKELVLLWRWLYLLLSSVEIIGQNFFNFDIIWLEAFGFKFKQVVDTYIRQHILWPELPRSLQFMCKQYTRQPFYKEEGKHWTVKHKKSYMRYNALDCCTTFAVWEAQEKEFSERPHLK